MILWEVMAKPKHNAGVEDKQNTPKVTAAWRTCSVLLPHLILDHVRAFHCLRCFRTSLVTFVIAHSVCTSFRLRSSSVRHATKYLYSVNIVTCHSPNDILAAKDTHC